MDKLVVAACLTLAALCMLSASPVSGQPTLESCAKNILASWLAIHPPLGLRYASGFNVLCGNFEALPDFKDCHAAFKQEDIEAMIRKVARSNEQLKAYDRRKEAFALCEDPPVLKDEEARELADCRQRLVNNYSVFKLAANFGDKSDEEKQYFCENAQEEVMSLHARGCEVHEFQSYLDTFDEEQKKIWAQERAGMAACEQFLGIEYMY